MCSIAAKLCGRRVLIDDLSSQLRTVNKILEILMKNKGVFCFKGDKDWA